MQVFWTKMPWARAAAVVASGLFLLTLAGCGSSGDGAKERARVSASGKVEFDGKPVAAGSVLFTHLDSGVAATCLITNGSYSSPRGGGPVIGKNVISISGTDKPDGQPLWNGVWSKEVEITGSNFSEDFKITPDQVKPPTEFKMDEEEAVWKE